ncbi:methyltransferase-like protein 27 isoform X2 [Tachypleus tridentatus]|uniref:methyltransferase-like protein 27 isoform X2 n=1 Tax=Tachypleus tridentatus TaxID=6853 RepID=UPI003FD4D16F
MEGNVSYNLEFLDPDLSIFAVESSSETTVSKYANTRDSYENNMLSWGYMGHYYTRDALLELQLAKHSRILDLLAGTGLLGIEVKKFGYENIDSLDGCAEMLEKAKEKKIYKRYFVSLLGEGCTLPIQDNTYDVIIMSGAIGYGHIYPSNSFPELIRISKPGENNFVVL